MWKRALPTGRTTASDKPLLLRTIPILSTSSLHHHKPLSTTAPLRKENPSTYDSNQREKLDPMSNEVTKSGTDDEVARSSTSYDASNTAPEGELAAGEQQRREEGKPGNPLDVSPANPEISAWRRPTEGQPEQGQEKRAQSGRGAVRKNRKVEVKEDGSHVAFR